MVTWTEEEVKYLKENYADTDSETLVKNLNRKIGTIRMKAYQFNLRKKRKIAIKNRYEIW